MKQTSNKKSKNVYVTIFLTESTTSFLSLDLPYLESSDPDNSKLCIITEADFKNAQEGTSTSHRDSESLMLASDLALFSVSNCSSNSEMYEIPEDESSGPSKSGSSLNSTKLFQKTKIICHPILSVRTTAHTSKLNSDGRALYISLLESDSRISSDFICRICHGGQSVDDLLTPCRCRGTIALVHLKCLERWLKESNHSSCELCKHHYQILREPKYSIPWSILVYLREPGTHLKELLIDLLAFTFYTPSAVASTYMLMLMCEALVKSSLLNAGTFSSHLIAFAAVFGMAAIDFTYSSWLILTIQKNVENWRDWYNAHSSLKVILPKVKMKPHKIKRKTRTQDEQKDN